MEAIVAVYRDWGIGADGTQPVVVRADRKRFREVTGSDAVLVGRKTLADFPGGKPLKGRPNIVLTRSTAEIPGARTVPDVPAAVAAAGEYERCLVIGGASVYRALFPWLTRVYVTKLDVCPVSDSFFPDLDADPAWTCADAGPWLEEDGVRYRFCVYERAEEPFDFDREIDRHGTDSLKYDFAGALGKPPDVLPLWVADMDFQAPPAVRAALSRLVDHGVFGYSGVKASYYEAAAAWFRDRFGWEPKREWLLTTPGVVFALAAAVRALTEPGDGVLIQPPVYYPFFSVSAKNGRRVVENRLLYRDGRYEIDFEDFEEKLCREKVKLFILCSPHNPVCRVWREEELRRMGELCQRYGVYVVSDEIHCDFAFPGHPHTVFAKACPELTERTVICTAPSKTFNLAGLQTSNIWVPGEETRKLLRRELDREGIHGPNVFGLTAARAAYESGGPWLDACRAYMRDNLDYLRDYLAERLPALRLVEPEGTYFAWIDCSGLGLSDGALEELVRDRAKLWLDGGGMFGGDAGQFQRVVLACTRKTLTEALERLEKAVSELNP